MALRDLFASKLARPAGRVLDAPIRDIVQEILREHGYASPAEIQALRDELRDLRVRLEGVDRKVQELALVADEARSEAAAARADAVQGLSLHAARTAPPPDPRVTALEALVAELDAALTAARNTPDPRVATLEARVSELEAALAAARAVPAPAPAPTAAPAPVVEAVPAAPAPLSAEPRSGCKVPGCGEAVRSKGFCSPHYQQWRRGTLKGFVNADGTAIVEGRVVHLPSEAVGAAVTLRDGLLYADGKPTRELPAS